MMKNIVGAHLVGQGGFQGYTTKLHQNSLHL